MKRVALIQDGLVKNVVLVDDEFDGGLFLDFDIVDVTEKFCGPGMIAVDGAFEEDPGSVE